MSTLRKKLEPDLKDLQTLGDKHRAIRTTLDLCGDNLSEGTYSTLKSLHDQIIMQKKFKIRKVTAILKESRETKKLYENQSEKVESTVNNVIYVDFTKKRKES